jgi:hypothetical protein
VLNTVLGSSDLGEPHSKTRSPGQTGQVRLLSGPQCFVIEEVGSEDPLKVCPVKWFGERLSEACQDVEGGAKETKGWLGMTGEEATCGT